MLLSMADLRAEAHTKLAGKRRAGDRAAHSKGGVAVPAQAGCQLSGTPSSGMISLQQIALSSASRM